MIKIVNSTVPSALIKLGYSEADVNAIVSYIDATGTIEGAPAIKPEHLAVFDCSFKPAKGTRSIHYMGHIKMMAAAQPFLSGAISKTVNLPNDCSVQDIADAYVESWKRGIKAVAIYRDGSKGTQPLNVSAQTDDNKKGTKVLTSAEAAAAPGSTEELKTALANLDLTKARVLELEAQMKALAMSATQNSESVDAKEPPRAVRHRLPAERASVTHKFALSGHEGYITVGLYPNGSPGEIFIRMAKEGSTVSGLMDSFATAISLALQHGVPLRVLCEKFAHTRFEPSGWTGNPEIGYAKSVMDYIFRWIQIRFLSGTQLDLFAGLSSPASVPVTGTISAPANTVSLHAEASLHPVQEYADRSAPRGGIAPDLTASSGLEAAPAGTLEDRGIYHTASAMKDLYDMGDSPSCATCGAIMTRSGSCYRCNECGSTSGCS
jgi:ribonucleoside-diphosphate reductase alpha chain